MNLWRPETSWELLVLRGLVVYVFIVLLLRLSGKRQVGQMSATDLVAIMLLSNAVQNSMNAGDNSLGGGLILAVIIVGLSWAISQVTYRSRRARILLEGTPTLLVHKGRIVEANLRRELISLGDLKILLRKQGIQHVSDVNTAILESDGSLTVSHVQDQPLKIVTDENELD